MDHVNNAVYADWLDEAVLAAGGEAAVRAVPRLARLEYAERPRRHRDRRRGVAGWRRAGLPGRRRRGRPAPGPAPAARRTAGATDEGAA